MHRKQNEHQTRQHRLAGHNYSEPGFYFITFGTKLRHELLGDIEDEQIILSPTGQALLENLESLPKEIDQLVIDSVAIMPDHVHLLIYLKIDTDPTSTSDIVRIIKGRSATIHRNLTQDTLGLWQKGFHDRIIRNDTELDHVRKYIAENRLRWGNEDGWRW